jgi:hypothetical protein
MTNQKILSFLAEQAAMEGAFGEAITEAWARQVYSAYSHYGEVEPDFTDADIAVIREEAEKQQE